MFKNQYLCNRLGLKQTEVTQILENGCSQCCESEKLMNLLYLDHGSEFKQQNPSPPNCQQIFKTDLSEKPQKSIYDQNADGCLEYQDFEPGSEPSEFDILRQQMSRIEEIAKSEIQKLKKALIQKDKIIADLQRDKKETKQIGINTDKDDRDQEIQVLREGIIRHIRINKQLTSKFVNYENMRGNIETQQSREAGCQKVQPH